MNRFVRRAIVGALSGGISSIALLSLPGNPGWKLAGGSLYGALYSVIGRPSRKAYVDEVMTAATFGIPLWGLISVVAVPYFSRATMKWDAEGIRGHFPELIGWVLYGAFLGLLIQVISDLVDRIWGAEQERSIPTEAPAQRIVILGGGFAGSKTAECLEKALRTNRAASITLVSETNALLFTPMLAEVAGSSLEPSHISTPLRGSLHRVQFIRGRVAAIDLANRRVSLDQGPGVDGAPPTREVGFDHLVLALGSVSNFLGMSNVEKYAFNFKSLLDAIRIRNHVIERFERADRQPDLGRRAPLLTFVVAGGGFAGVELAGALNDFAHGILPDYPNVTASEVRIVLVHARERILPELSESLGKYAQVRMEARGVEFRLNARVQDVEPGRVTLSDGTIAAETLIWTAGTAPNPIVRSLPLETDKRGAVCVTPSLAVPGHPGIWALGDCAAVIDAKSGQPCPPTAQFALREADTVAKNIAADLEGRPARGFHFNSLGSLCVIGHQTACAELTVPFARSKSIRFSGLFAWMLWRAIYLSKLPGIERKIRVFVDWNIELFFPRDIVQTIDLQ